MFPGDAVIAFQAADPNQNTVVVEGPVDVVGLSIGVGGYSIEPGAGGVLQQSGADPIDINMATGTDLAISVAIDGELDVTGNGVLALGGTQNALTDINVETFAELQFSGNAGGASLTNSGTTTNSGTLGSVTNIGTFNNDAVGSTSDGFTNLGSALLQGNHEGSLFNNAGGSFVADGDLSFGILLDNDGTALIDAGTTSIPLTQNNGDLTIAVGATLTSNVTNEENGTMVIDGVLDGNLSGTTNSIVELTGQITGDVTMSVASLTASGAAVINGNLSNGESGVSLTSQSSASDDVLTIVGDLQSDGFYELDLVATANGLSSDRIVVDGVTTGSVSLSFNSFVSGVSTDRVLVFDVNEAAANNFSFDANGLPVSSELTVYSLIQENGGDLYVVSQLNPAVGSVSANIVLTQSLIGALVNRPTSPFVVGLSYDDPDPCGAGAWSRFQGGQAEASTRSANGVSQVESTVNADYAGFQAGGDFACFRGGSGGWDLALGAVGGFNQGNIEQPIFAIDPLDPTQQINTQTSVTETDFQQNYVAIYGTASRGRWAADLQLRQEKTDFTFTNKGLNGEEGIGLQDAELDTDATTLSGAVSYTFPIPDTEFAIVPTAGFAATRGTAGTIEFEDGSDLEVGDFESDVGFVGLTGARQSFLNNGTGALSQFVTATYYADFSNEITSTLVTTDDEPQQTSNNTLGSYSELSVGTNYVQVLQSGSFAGAKQYSASLRGDLRFGGQVDSWGLVGQLRVQF